MHEHKDIDLVRVVVFDFYLKKPSCLEGFNVFARLCASMLHAFLQRRRN